MNTNINERYIIRGQALIIWDPNNKDKKLDNIDTDQITPSDFCISEKLERIDDNWKKGVFHYLIPDFRKRVHNGQTFVIVGNRFGVGSSREMSPAGLKAVAKEAGLELVIVCGNQIGDIFRRSALNIGLQIIQCPQAVEEAQDNHEFNFNTITHLLENITLKKKYHPISFSESEEELIQSGGIFMRGHKEYKQSLGLTREIIWPTPEQTRKMTVSEQILHAHLVDKSESISPGVTVKVFGDLFPVSDGTAPFTIYTFNQITKNEKQTPHNPAIIQDHFTFTGKKSHRNQTNISCCFARAHHLKAPIFARPGKGIFHFYLPEQGLIIPGGLYVGADSHARTYGAYGSIGIGAGSTTLGFAWATGYIHYTVPANRRITFHGKLRQGVSGKDVALTLIKHLKGSQAHNSSMEMLDRDLGLQISDRHTIANMMAEAEVKNAIFVSDINTYKWFSSRDFELTYPPLTPGEQARYESDDYINLSDIEPMVAKPFSPSNVVPAKELVPKKIRFSKAMIGSCTNGSYEDLFQAALVFYRAKKIKINRIAKNIKLIVIPGSQRIANKLKVPEASLGNHSVSNLLIEFGATIRNSWCGPCFGVGEDILKEGEVAITTFNRNWQNRNGVGGLNFLASPSTVAASALVGYISSAYNIHEPVC